MRLPSCRYSAIGLVRSQPNRCYSGFLCTTEHILDFVAAIAPDSFEWAQNNIVQHKIEEHLAHWPTDATADKRPVHCHSHNDYWRKAPLYSAIDSGCSSVEVDVWLIDGVLYVGHRRLTLTSKRTLQNLYIQPLLKLLEMQNPLSPFHSDGEYPSDPNENFPLNGVFDTDPTQTLVLLVDFKSYGPDIWWELQSQLSPLRDKGYLTFFNGTDIVERPITVVGTGDTPFEWLTANETYRDVFFDAPLAELADDSLVWPNPNRAQDPSRARKQSLPRPFDTDPGSGSGVGATTGEERKEDNKDCGTARVWPVVDQGNLLYNKSNSYYASVSFTKSIGRIWGSRLRQDQLQLIRSQIRGAHRRGLKVRYWGLPQWPIGLRNHIWHILMREGTDVLSVDDLYGATQTDWRRERSRSG